MIPPSSPLEIPRQSCRQPWVIFTSVASGEKGRYGRSSRSVPRGPPNAQPSRVQLPACRPLSRRGPTAPGARSTSRGQPRKRCSRRPPHISPRNRRNRLEKPSRLPPRGWPGGPLSREQLPACRSPFHRGPTAQAGHGTLAPRRRSSLMLRGRGTRT